MTKHSPRSTEGGSPQSQGITRSIGSEPMRDLEALYELVRHVSKAGKQAVDASRELRAVVRARNGSEPPLRNEDLDR
jgi:hypothetical protein